MNNLYQETLNLFEKQIPYAPLKFWKSTKGDVKGDPGKIYYFTYSKDECVIIMVESKDKRVGILTAQATDFQRSGIEDRLESYVRWYYFTFFGELLPLTFIRYGGWGQELKNPHSQYDSPSELYAKVVEFKDFIRNILEPPSIKFIKEHAEDGT
jgi:hypothetical protein